MVVMAALPQGQTLRSRCRFSVEVYPEAAQRHPLTQSRATKSTAVTAGFIIVFCADYLDDGDLPAFLKSRLILLFRFRQKVLQDVLTEVGWGRGTVTLKRKKKNGINVGTAGFVKFYNKQTTHNHLKG